jgi:glycosyltransferase involved in cell wall biosynthesis
MCVWNPRRDWFHEAVRSVLDQRDCDLELVVVDDGSDEPVEGLLADFDDPRMCIVRVDHGGLSRARDAGTHAASGRFFRFVDGDDVLEPESCARLLRLAQEQPDGAIAYGATLVCDEELRPRTLMTSALEGWVAEDCLLYRFDVRHLSMLFPRPVVDAVGQWDPTLTQCQDWDYVLRALEHAPVRGNEAIATFYRRHASAVAANSRGALDFESLVVDRYFERHPERRGTALEREARAKLLLVRAAAAPRLGDGRRAQIRLVVRAARLHPRRTALEVAGAARRLVRSRVPRPGRSAES